MKVKEAIEQLQKMPQEAELMVPSLTGSVSITRFTKVGETWVDTEFEEEAPDLDNDRD